MSAPDFTSTTVTFLAHNSALTGEPRRSGWLARPGLAERLLALTSYCVVVAISTDPAICRARRCGWLCGRFCVCPCQRRSADALP
jgi:hypothetical protein